MNFFLLLFDLTLDYLNLNERPQSREKSVLCQFYVIFSMNMTSQPNQFKQQILASHI